MKKATVFLFFCCLFWGGYTAKATHTEPAIVAEPFPVCTLPAPANLQYTLLNPYTVQFTWDSVPGAAGYRSVLTNLSTGAQTITQGANNNSTFPIIPGDEYNFMVAAMCSMDPPVTSTNTSDTNFKSPVIIIEIVIKLSCTSDGSLVNDNDGDNTNNFWQYDWDLGHLYYVQLTKIVSEGGLPQVKKLKIGFIRDEPTHFITDELYDEGPGILCGYLPYPNNTYCYSTPDDGYNSIKFTYAESTIHFAFPSLTQGLFWYYEQGEQPFDGVQIYECGSRPEKRTDQVSDSPNSASYNNELLQVAAVNPFSDQLTLYFTEFPEGPVRTRLFDLQGIPQIETVIRPGQLTENMYSLRTDALPAGMYFLQFETPSGQVVTQKVLKI